MAKLWGAMEIMDLTFSTRERYTAGLQDARACNDGVLRAPPSYSRLEPEQSVGNSVSFEIGVTSSYQGLSTASTAGIKILGVTTA